VKHLAEDVGDIVDAAYNGVKYAFTGTFDVDDRTHLAAMSFNFDFASRSVVNTSLSLGSADVRCTGCYATFDAYAVLNVNISNYQLMLAEAYLDADTEFAIGAALNVSFSTPISGSVNFTAEQFPEVCFSVIGVPVCIDADLPVQIGYDLDVAASAALSGGVNGSGHTRYGFYYTASDGFHGINQKDLNYSSGNLSLDASVAVDVSVYLLPSLVMNVDFIGGPSVGLNFFLEGHFDNGTPFCNATDDVQVVINAGLQASVGAKLNVTTPSGTVIYQKGPFQLAVYSMKRTLYSQCLQPLTGIASPVLIPHPAFGVGLGAHGNGLSDALIGSSWFGVGTVKSGPYCVGLPPIVLAYQYVSTGNQSFFISAVNTMYNVSQWNVECVLQQQFVVQFSPPNKLVFGADNHAQNVFYTACQEGGYGPPVINGVGTIDANATEIHFSVVSSVCYNDVVLYRQ
jgi:hypothetical protein